MTPEQAAEKLLALLNSPDGRAAGFHHADPIEGQPTVIGVEVDDELFFIEVQPA